MAKPGGIPAGLFFRYHIRMSLRTKIFLALFGTSAVFLVGIFVCLYLYQERDTELRSKESFAHQQAAYADLLKQEERSLRITANLLAADAGPLEPWAKRSGADLLFRLDAEGRPEGPAPDHLAEALTGFFTQGMLKRDLGWLRANDTVYRLLLAPRNGGGWVGVGYDAFRPDGPDAPMFQLFLERRAGGWIPFAGGPVVGEDSVADLQPLSEEVQLLNLANARPAGRYLARLEPGEGPARLALLMPLAPFEAAREKMLSAIAAGGGVLLLVIAILSRILSDAMARPISALANTARELHPAGEAHHRDEMSSLATTFTSMADTLESELEAKEAALKKLEGSQKLLVQLNRELAKRLFENKVMLTLWREQAKSEDTKSFLSKMLEEVLHGMPFTYGCIIIRPIASIGPEVIFARVERDSDKAPLESNEVSVFDVLDRKERTQWLSNLSPELKSYLLQKNQETPSVQELLQGMIHASVLPGMPTQKLSVVSVALSQGKQHLGSLHLISEQQNFHLRETDKEFLQSLATQVAALLDNRALQFATRVDPLTQLYNRGYMNDRLREEIVRTSRTNRPFTFLLLDIDHFKQVNDTHGHPAGDEVLVGLANLLKRSCRASDTICRYGGEEIAILLADTSGTGAQVFAENIRKLIEREEFPVDVGKSLRITASIGFAEFPSHAQGAEDLIKNADDALYRAKREGRNDWRMHGS